MTEQQENAVIVAYDALLELAYHPAFAGDAPQFNEGGVGYVALTLLRQAFEELV